MHSFPDSRILASSSFVHAERDAESWRVLKVKQYINDHYAGNLRLGSAARLLVDTTQSISEICYSCGRRSAATRRATSVPCSRRRVYLYRSVKKVSYFDIFYLLRLVNRLTFVEY